MGTLNIGQGSTLFLDSAPIIYYVDGISPYAEMLLPLFAAIEDDFIQAVTSAITFAEILVIPYRLRNEAVIEKYNCLIPHFDIYGIDLNTARYAAEIRAEYKLKTPDAIQWATFSLRNADYFLTNDKQFKQLDDKRVLLLDDFV